MNLQDTNTTHSSFRSGFVAVVGRPSVGKSTFINLVCGNNTVITSPHPQTTRNIIRGIITKPAYQVVLLDTPGIHISGSRLGKQLTQHAHTALQDAEVILYMLDASRSPQEEESTIIALLKKHDTPIFVAINKMDIENPSIIHKYLELLRNTIKDKIVNCHFISAQDNINISNLLDDIATVLPEQDAFYPEEYYTDQTPEFRICEQIRGAILEYVKEELPHAFYTEIIESTIKHRNNHGEPSHVFIRAQIVVERSSQQGILIGRNGSMIKKIRQTSNKYIQPLFPYNVQLELRVVVNKKWKKNNAVISQL